jgi:hypothetical protein
VNLRPLALIAVVMFFPVQPTAAELRVPDFKARYSIQKAGLDVISTTISLQRTPERIEYRSQAEPVGIASWFFRDQRVDELSVLARVEPRVVPLEYHYTHEGSDKNRNERYRYDWATMTADVDYRGEEKTLEIPRGTMDNFSLQLALIQDAGRGHKVITHPVISRGELKTYTFKNLGREAVDTPLGEFDTVKLQRRKDDEENTTYTTWYAPELNYLPVKVENQENGDVVLSLTLEELEWL